METVFQHRGVPSIAAVVQNSQSRAHDSSTKDRDRSWLLVLETYIPHKTLPQARMAWSASSACADCPKSARGQTQANQVPKAPGLYASSTKIQGHSWQQTRIALSYEALKKSCCFVQIHSNVHVITLGYFQVVINNRHNFRKWGASRGMERGEMNPEMRRGVLSFLW